jgi:hypothetical protein
MIRLRKLHISGFRGARFDLPLYFTKDYRSVSIFGERLGLPVFRPGAPQKRVPGAVMASLSADREAGLKCGGSNCSTTGGFRTHVQDCLLGGQQIDRV